MKKVLPFLLVLYLLSGCNEEKSAPVVSTSPNGHIKITITGKRENSLSPWSLQMLAEAKGLKGNVNIDFYGSEVSDKTISFVWEKDQSCTITLTEKDKTQRIFQFIPNGADAMWKDLSPK